MKFLIVYGVLEIHKDQDLVHHYYHITLRGVGTANVYLVKGLDTHDELVEQREELVEDFISIPLTDRNEEHIVQIGSNLNQVTKDQLILFLLENANVFA